LLPVAFPEAAPFPSEVAAMPSADPSARIYVCSHFADMPAERDHLRQVVFPKLRARLAEQGRHLEVVDLRRDAGEDADGAAGLPRALEEIDRCRPFFVVLLGERYGPALDLSEEVLQRHPWLRDYAGCSRLYLEIIHGILRAPEQPVPALVYLRDPAFLDGVPEPRRRQFVEPYPAAAQKMAGLKRALRVLRAAEQARLSEYTCRWDADRDTIVGLEEFGERVLAQLVQVLLPARDGPLRAQLRQEPTPTPVRFPWPPSGEERISPELLGPAAEPERPPYLDDNVQFTVYRPRAVQPDRWYPLLAFAHLSEKQPEAAADEPDPAAEVYRQAQQVLGNLARDYQDVTQDSRLAVPRDGEITFVPEVPGVQFNPPRRTFVWQEPVHREDFRMRAPADLDGKTARGRLTVYLGHLILADVSLTIRVDSRARPAAADTGEASAARPYRKIFASYSHQDMDIVRQVEVYVRALGDEYLRDWTQLRAGEVWNDQLMQLIEDADVFQLFWSTNSMRSAFVRREWEHALRLNRPNFIRPTYWQEPMPEDTAAGLPPEALRRLQFARLFVEGWTHPALGTPGYAAPEAATVTASAAAAPGGSLDADMVLSSQEDEEEVRGVFQARSTAPPPPPLAAARPAVPQRDQAPPEEVEPRFQRRREPRYDDDEADYAPRTAPDWKRERSRKKGRSWWPWLILAFLALVALLAGLRFWHVF
jgi:hypothetical protein